MTYNYKCPICMASIQIETDDEKMAEKSLKKYKKNHGCRRRCNERQKHA